MAFVTAYDLRLSAPLSRSFRSGDVRIGFSQGCDLILPGVLSPDLADLIQEPILTVERACCGGFAVKVHPIVVASASVGSRIRLAKIPSEDALHEDRGEYMTLQTGDCVAVNVFKLNRLGPVFDARRNLWPVCHLQVYEPKELQLPDPEEDEEPDPDPPSPFLHLLPEVKLHIVSYLDFETVSVVLPAVCQDFFSLARCAVADPPDFCLKIGPKGSHLREFLSIYTRSGLDGIRFGETLETLELRGSAMRLARVAVNFESFVRMLPNLRSLTVGKGVFIFVAAGSQDPAVQPFTSKIKQFRLHWSAMTAYPSAFPFSTLMPKLESVVIVSSSEGYYDNGVFHERHFPELAALEHLRELTLAWCSLIPTAYWRTFFEGLEGKQIEVLRIPGCAGVDDQALQASSCILPHLQLFETTKVRGITDDGITSMVRRCRRLKALLVTHFHEMRGSDWLKMAASRESSVEYVDATGSGCARAVPTKLKEVDGEMKKLLRRGAFVDLMPS